MRFIEWIGDTIWLWAFRRRLNKRIKRLKKFHTNSTYS